MEPGSASKAGGRARLRRWMIALVFAFLSILLTGYHFEGQDNDLWIPYVQHAADASLFTRDPVLQSPQGRLTFHVDLMAFMSRALPLSWCFFLAFLACHAAAFIGVAELAAAMGESELVVLLALVLWCVPHDVGWTASFTLSDSLIPRRFAEALVPFTLLAVLLRRPVLAGALVGLLFLLHPISAACLVPGLVAGLLVQPRPIRAAAVFLLLALVGVAAVLLHGRAPPEPASSLTRLQWVAMLRSLCPYGFAGSTSIGTWLATLVPVVVLVVALARGRLPKVAGVMALASLAWILVTAVVGEGLAIPAVIQLQSGRALHVPILLGALAAATLLADLWTRSVAAACLAGALLAALGMWLGSPLGNVTLARVAVVLAVAAGAALLHAVRTRVPEASLRLAWLLVPAAFVVAGDARALHVPWERESQPFDALCEWARTLTPRDALFAVPPSARGFRGRAQRACVLEPHDVNAAFFSRRYAQRWMERRERFWSDVPLETREKALADGTIDVLVVESRERRAPEPPVAFADDSYVAYVRPDWPLTRPGGG